MCSGEISSSPADLPGLSYVMACVSSSDVKGCEGVFPVPPSCLGISALELVVSVSSWDFSPCGVARSRKYISHPSIILLPV